MDSKILIKINYLSEQKELELPKTLEDLYNFIFNNLKIDTNLKNDIVISYEDEDKDKINILSEEDYNLFVSVLKEKTIKNEITINENGFNHKFSDMQRALLGDKDNTSNNLFEMTINSESDLSMSYKEIKDRKTKEKENEEILKKEYEKKIIEKEEEFKNQLKSYEKDNNLKIEKLNSEINLLKQKLKEENEYKQKIIEQEKEFKKQLDLKEKENILKNEELISLKEQNDKIKKELINKIKEKEKAENEYLNIIKEKEKIESEYK